MKNLITTFAFTLILGSTLAFADTKNKVDAKSALPASMPALETPAPQNGKTTNEYNKYTPAQKAAIVELKVAK
jgi:hypothetical protein